MKINELQYLWKITKAAALTVGFLFSFFAVVEYVRAYNTLYELNRFVGYGFLFVTFVGLVWLSWRMITSILSRPKAIVPPKIKDWHSASRTELKRYARYLEKYLTRLCVNPYISEVERSRAITGLEKISRINHDGSFEDELLGSIRQTETDTILPLLEKLDVVAEREVQNCVRDIMIGVSLSPYRAVDLFIVLYRNAAMITNVVRIYNTRPHLKEQLTIIKDVISVMAAVNFINFGSRFMEQLMSTVPYIGTIVDDMAQGIGAGLLTSATGHAAIYRCRAYQGWNREESMKIMASKITQFFSDVNGIFRNDVLPSLRYKIASPETWEKISNGFASVFEKMSDVVRGFVRVPPTVNLGNVRGSNDIFQENGEGLTLIRKMEYFEEKKSVLNIYKNFKKVVERVKERSRCSKVREFRSSRFQGFRR